MSDEFFKKSFGGCFPSIIFRLPLNETLNLLPPAIRLAAPPTIARLQRADGSSATVGTLSIGLSDGKRPNRCALASLKSITSKNGKRTTEDGERWTVDGSQTLNLQPHLLNLETNRLTFDLKAFLLITFLTLEIVAASNGFLSSAKYCSLISR